MQKVLRTFYLCIVILGLMIFAFPHPLLLEPQAAQGSETPEKQSEAVFRAATRNFELLASLFNDVTYVADSIYPVVLKADNHQAAIDYLKPGFDGNLAETIVNYYLAWDEGLQKMVVIPTDSIPLVNTDDRKRSNIVFIDTHHAVIQCLYQNCYTENDSYIYTVHLYKDGNDWKISEVVLEESRAGQ